MSTEKKEWQFTTNQSGEFVRKPSTFRDSVTKDGSSGYKAEAGRYVLIVSLACPWAHRTLVVRALKGLEKTIDVFVVDYVFAENGWKFIDDGEKPGCRRFRNYEHLKDIYFESEPNFEGRYTVPVLYDTKTNRIVNNESSEIIRFLGTEFDDVAIGQTEEQKQLRLYPEDLRAQIDEINEFVYPNINNGVYRCGFATSQQAYDRAFDELFNALDRLEGRLSSQRYLCGDRFTEADVRLFTTLFRFDHVYITHFKTNLRRLVDYPNLFAYARDIYQMPGVADTCDVVHCKGHYFESHRQINPYGIIPKGPLIDFDAPHDRASL